MDALRRERFGLTSTVYVDNPFPFLRSYRGTCACENISNSSRRLSARASSAASSAQASISSCEPSLTLLADAYIIDIFGTEPIDAARASRTF